MSTRPATLATTDATMMVTEAPEDDEEDLGGGVVPPGLWAAGGGGEGLSGDRGGEGTATGSASHWVYEVEVTIAIPDVAMYCPEPKVL